MSEAVYFVLPRRLKTDTMLGSGAHMLGPPYWSVEWRGNQGQGSLPQRFQPRAIKHEIPCAQQQYLFLIFMLPLQTK